LAAQPEPALLLWTERGASAIEALAVVMTVAFIFSATAAWLFHMLARRPLERAAYERYRVRLGRALLLGLEILVAADVVRTVALEPTLSALGGLAVLVLVRTFLSWSIILEVEGRWPWQARPAQVSDSPTQGA
jgi:uncharacterized membrane protein